MRVAHLKLRGGTGAETVGFVLAGEPVPTAWKKAWAKVAAKAQAEARAEERKRSGVDDRPGGDAARWAANKISDGLRERRAVVITRQEADTIVKAARDAAGPRRKGRGLKPAFDVSRSDAAIRKRLAVYQKRLDRLACEGRPPTLLLARSISRDIALLDKYQRRWRDRYWRSAVADRPDFDP